MQRISPFILMDYNAPYTFPAASEPVGVGPHPHRGFETVTFAFAGKVEHADNQGNRGVIEPGDIQWMTAASGILHKEYHETEYAQHERVFHMVQLWVNLPAKDKMAAPRYQALTKEQMGKYILPDDGGQVAVHAGEAFGVKGPAMTFSPMNVYQVKLNEGHTVELEEPSDFNVGFLVAEGQVSLNEDQTLEHADFAVMQNKPGVIRVKGLAPTSHLLVLSGQPLNEPIAAMGPFVMNTEAQLRQANMDFHSGKFGSLDF